jgi:hypothetical protein
VWYCVWWCRRLWCARSLGSLRDRASLIYKYGWATYSECEHERRVPHSFFEAIVPHPRREPGLRPSRNRLGIDNTMVPVAIPAIWRAAHSNPRVLRCRLSKTYKTFVRADDSAARRLIALRQLVACSIVLRHCDITTIKLTQTAQQSHHDAVSVVIRTANNGRQPIATVKCIRPVIQFGVVCFVPPFPGATWPSNRDKRIASDEVNSPAQHGRPDRSSTHGDHMKLRDAWC